ncbi:hypothetical protein L1987_55726 [Smallanthus sonchifolius]|uniref:Uncharacterized protein n=1 Tax=Smallanthus sonchifolius TaxID=185202 RepID=A0ACB9EAU0_9ASTR|nr:hypothetical protein L1987_55726 [Smallanthus sonchifolius]
MPHLNSWTSTQIQLKTPLNPHSHPSLLRCTLLANLFRRRAKMPLNSTTCAVIAVESQAARLSHACCAFLRGNVHCKGKRTDVTRGDESPLTHHGTHTRSGNSKDDEELTHHHSINCFPETLERFEKFREDVKNRAYNHQNKHPRNIVDGNEKLMFYGTKLTRCKKFGTSKLCRDDERGDGYRDLSGNFRKNYG